MITNEVNVFLFFFCILITNLFYFQSIKDFYDRLSEPETEMLLNASRQFSGRMTTGEEVNEEEDQEENRNIEQTNINNNCFMRLFL